MTATLPVLRSGICERCGLTTLVHPTAVETLVNAGGQQEVIFGVCPDCDTLPPGRPAV